MGRASIAPRPRWQDLTPTLSNRSTAGRLKSLSPPPSSSAGIRAARLRATVTMAFRRGHPDATRRSRIARDEARQVRVGAEDGAARTELWGTHAAIAETNGLG